MLKKHPTLIFISIVMFTSLACNAFARGGTEPVALELPPQIINAEGTAVSNDSLAPTATLPSDAPVEGTAVSAGSATVNIIVDLNIRSGPGVVFERLGFFTKGATVPVLGRETATGWWLVQCPPNVTATQCWVSGGPEYTASTNADGIPIAQSPPTPTPVPTNTPAPDMSTDVAIGAGVIAYADNSGLWILPLETGDSLPAAGTPVQIVADPNIQRVLIAPDGRSIVFVTGDFEQNSLHVVGVDGNGRSQLISSVGLPLPEDAVDVALLISQMAWLPDSRAIAFNSRLQNLVGPGTLPQQDLWIATVNGEVTERFTAGDGGDTFAISPNGQQIIFGRPEEMVRANMDGSGVETAVTFPFINTASEYAYAPTAQWLPDSSAALVAIPDADPWQATTTAALFRIPRSGTAVPLGSLLGNILFSPVKWTASGNNLAYVQMVPDGSSEQALTLAQGSGQNPQSYRVGEQLTLYEWSPNNSSFLYASNGFYAVGQPGVAPIEIPTSSSTSDMQWIHDTAFVALVGTVGNWDLKSGNLAGETAVMRNISKDFVPLDVWIP